MSRVHAGKRPKVEAEPRRRPAEGSYPHSASPVPLREIEDALNDAANGGSQQEALRRIASIVGGPAEHSNEGKEIRTWPSPPDRAAFSGLAGEIIRTIEPHSESDPTALLLQLLITFGCLAGRRAHYLVEGTPHYPNENGLVVGSTSAARKGTSLTHILNLARRVEVRWSSEQITPGLSSGEGLIHAVRDPTHPNADGKGGDPGVTDKRLLIVESEFSNALKVMQRDGNTLSEVVRQAWDSGRLRTLTRSQPLRATDAHVAIIGHITPAELRRLLKDVDVANGLLNRFMLIAVRRSKYLPDGGSLADGDMEYMARQLGNAVAFAREAGRIRRDDAAHSLWNEKYPSLADRPGGLLGAATSRAAPHVLRLSLLYALLDRSAIITRPHLEAALAFWRYVEESTRFFFGDSLGDPIADSILAALRDRGELGLARSEISALSGRHWSSDQIDDALQRLATDGLAIGESVKTAGRSKEVWKSTNCAKKAKEAQKAANGGGNSLSSLISQNGETESPGGLSEAWEPDPTQAEAWGEDSR